jgi:integrase/recombinase XerD
MQSNLLDFGPIRDRFEVEQSNLHEGTTMTTWTVDRSKILQPDEIRQVLTDLNRKARRSLNTRLNRVVFRLATCCGLRASEIGAIKLADVQVDNSRPSIRIRREVGKGHKARKVPLTWDAGTLADLREWKQFRIEQGATDADLFVCSQHRDSLGHQLDRRNLRKRFQLCCKCLKRPVTIHDGRHSFISHALHGGRSVVEVQAAAGHSSLATTTIYSHLIDDGDETVGNLFG